MTLNTADDVLMHFGRIGMKWGKHTFSTGGSKAPTDVAVTVRPGRHVKTSGGTGQTSSEDAITVAKSKQTAKKSSLDSLSNKELQAVVTRMNLTQQYHTLKTNDTAIGKVKNGNKLAKEILAIGTTVNLAIAFGMSPAGKALKNQIFKKKLAKQGLLF